MKKFISIILIGLLAFGLVACDDIGSQKNDNEVENNIEKKESDELKDKDENTGADTKEDDDKESILPENIKKKEAILYFVNKEYIETGNEDLEKYIPLNMSIEVEDGAIAEAIVNALIAGPSDKYDVDNGIPEGLKLIDLNLKEDGLLYINFSSENLHGGSLQEELLIGQMVNSLLELDTIKSIQFMVNGEITESLMGHYDTSQPFTEKLK